MSGTFSTLTPCGQGVVLVGRGDPLVRRAVADPRRDAAVQVQRRPVVLEAHACWLRVLGAQRVADLVRDRCQYPSGSYMAISAIPEPIRVLSVGRNRSPSASVRQQVAEDDPHRLVLGRGDDRAEPLRRGHAAVARGDGRRGPSSMRVRQSGTVPGAQRRCALRAARSRGPGSPAGWTRTMVRYCTRPISYWSASMPLDRHGYLICRHRERDGLRGRIGGPVGAAAGTLGLQSPGSGSTNFLMPPAVM